MYTETDFQLTEEQKLLKQAVYDFSHKEIAPLAHEIDSNNLFPATIWPKLGALGMHGITVPMSLGGSEMGYLAHVLAMEEISRASAAIGLSYGAHSNLCINQLARFANEEQLKAYLPGLLSGEQLGALAMSEVNAGSDVIGMKTTALEDGDHYILNGRKMWITNGPSADVIITYAKTDPEAGSRGISAFIITPDMAGFTPGKKLDKMGMRGSDTCELIFDQCRVPKTHRLGDHNQGTHIMMSGLNYERVVLAAGPLGIMQACLDQALAYVHDRKQFGQPIGEFQLIQGKIADMYVALSTARCFVYNAARNCDNGSISNRDAAAAILFAAERATQLALETIQIFGGNGYINEYPCARLLRDAKLYEIGAGTSEIRRLIIGKSLYKETGH